MKKQLGIFPPAAEYAPATRGAAPVERCNQTGEAAWLPHKESVIKLDAAYEAALGELMDKPL